MPEYLRIGEVATALGVSVDTLRRWEADGRVEFERQRNQRVLRSDKLPDLLHLHSGGPRTSSARNRMAGIVVSVKKDSVMAQVELVCGDFRIVSLMSREAADDLGLEPGSPATAVVKATTVIVEA
ncbi:molybdopterin-binding protein [Nocardioides sp.]|uniref:TOBE domain-containing protein n=1 Tax=Nocardioides sp. TaxID=35761 RepID=UPI0027286083|nr:TOBE domain-containing protein [Nocardioides sp.]MDO9454670.1 TOBE domain-containing protein [Nocardioides sp.]